MTTATITLFTTEPFVGEFGTFDLTVTDLQAEDTAISLTRIEATTGDIATATRGVALTGTNFAGRSKWAHSRDDHRARILLL